MCMVDEGRMRGRSAGRSHLSAFNVYRNAGLDLRDGTKPLVENRRHMIIIVGCHKNKSELLINDPAHGPFLRMPTDCLFLNSCYANPQELDTFQFGDRIEPAGIIPVTPKGVTMPLLNWARTGGNRSEPLNKNGLLDIQRDFNPGRHFKGLHRFSLSEPLHGEFALKTIRELAEMSTDLKEANRLLKEQNWNEDHWVWLETNAANFTLIWNAQADPSDFSDYAKFLMAVGARQDGQITHWEPGEALAKNDVITQSPHVRQSTVLDQSNISPAIITSASKGGISNIDRYWNGKPKKLDLYCFFAADGKALLSPYSLFRQSKYQFFVRRIRNLCFFATQIYAWIPLKIDQNLTPPTHIKRRPWESYISPECNVCGWLASKGSDNRFARQVAERLLKIVEPSRECVAACSFFPGITSDCKDTRLEAIRALRCLLQIVAEYNKRAATQIRVVEIVGGGLIGSREVRTEIRAGRKKPLVIASISARSEIIRRILESFESLADVLPADVSLALELEPGPLFAIAKWQMLEELIRALDSSASFKIKSIRNRIGLNCDIAHWSLADISVDQMWNDVCERGLVASNIIHSHISDFGKGHLGDLSPGAVNGEDFFLDWMQILSRAYPITKEKGRHPTGHVSLELELPDSMNTLVTAIHATNNICKRLNDSSQKLQE